MRKILSYPRTVLATLFYPFFVLSICVLVITGNLLFNSRRWDDFFMQLWGKGSCALFGVKLQVYGFENMPAGGALLVFNHTSFFDIFALAATVKGLRFGAKIELFSIPFFGYAMKRIGILPIARQRREEVFKIYQASEKRIQNGEKFALAPEGTRHQGESLGQFKSGPFVFAINAKAPLVPVVILNANNILPKGQIFPNWGIWAQTIEVRVLPAVRGQDFTLEQRPLLQEQVRSAMLPFF